MCMKCLTRCNCRDNYCDRRCVRCCYHDNGGNDFLWPMLFWLIRDMTRGSRCGFVDRYDRFRC